MPLVWREYPNAILHAIMGRDHKRAAKISGKQHLLETDSRIQMQGFVEDVGPAYAAADVVAIPLLVSAGTNIKVLEAMACGRAIVSTPQGCQGLDLENGRELIVAGNDVASGDFSAAIVHLLRNEDLRNQIALNARRTAECRFGWDTIAAHAFSCYAALVDNPLARVEQAFPPAPTLTKQIQSRL
jgi:glycosyltransferase involved in cell wall biosynthesis